jgi:hydrogenase nickel incorporation protein HypA/HybF
VHEYSIIAALADQVSRVAAAHPGAQVHKLHVQIGELAGVEVDLLRTAYETFRGATICRDAALEIHPVAATWACGQCGQAIEVGAVLRCPRCDRPARLCSGDEIVLQRVEMEVPDV